MKRYDWDYGGMEHHPEGDYVTHADYRALEEDRDSWRRVAEVLELEKGKINRELASLRERVDGLQDRIDAYQEKGLVQ